MSAATRAEVCAVACAEAYRGNGEVIASAFGTIPRSASPRAAHVRTRPGGVGRRGRGGARDVGGRRPADGEVEAWLPFNQIFDLVWNGKRHIMMIPTQLDVYGNCNISAIGDHERRTCSCSCPRRAGKHRLPPDQLLGAQAQHPGVRAQGRHGVRRRQRQRAQGGSGGHPVPRIAPCRHGSGGPRLHAGHRPAAPGLRASGVTVDDVVAATGFDLVIPDSVPQTRTPSAEELELIRTVIDPRNLRDKEVPA